MNFNNKNIWILTDGSQGMISQVLGLAEQISYNINSIETKLLFPWSKLQPGFLPTFFWSFKNKLDLSFNPDIIISCGRKSVYLSLFLKKKYKNVVNIHIQNPKINFKSFDYIISPKHDNIKGKNVLESIGAIHKFNSKLFDNILDKNFDLPINNLITVILGGSNNHYRFSLKESEILISNIINLINKNSKYNFLILHSRRTSKETKKLLFKKLKGKAYIWQEEDLNPYGFSLKHSDFFIVTSDSTSMISECAYTGKPIYVYELPLKRNSKRIQRFHDQFKNLNITKKLNEIKELTEWNYKTLNESERIASIIKERIIKEKS